MVITVNGMCGSVFPDLQFAPQARSFKSQCSVCNIFFHPSLFQIKVKNLWETVISVGSL